MSLFILSSLLSHSSYANQRRTRRWHGRQAWWTMNTWARKSRNVSIVGQFLKTDPGAVAMVIRVKLFIFKPCETNANWHCMVARGRLCFSSSSVWQGMWMNSSTLITMAIVPGSVARNFPLIYSHNSIPNHFLLINQFFLVKI